MYKIKILSSEIVLSDTVGNTVNSATVVRVLHTGGVGSHHLITVKNSSNDTIGSFTIPTGTPEYIEKSPTDLLFVDSGTDVLVSKVAFR